MSLGAMGTGEKILELSNLAASLLTFMQGRKAGHGTGASSSSAAPKGGIEVITEAIKGMLKAFGVGNYDEAEYGKLFGQLSYEDQREWTALFAELTHDERKSLQLLIFLMEPRMETEHVPPIIGKDKVITKPESTITRPVKDENVRLQFMQSTIASIRAHGDGGAKAVAGMLRTNELVGDGSAFAKFKETREKAFNEFKHQLALLTNFADKPVPMSLIGRFFNLFLIGGKVPEPIFQGDGLIKKPLLRMLGIRTQRS